MVADLDGQIKAEPIRQNARSLALQKHRFVREVFLGQYLQNYNRHRSKLAHPGDSAVKSRTAGVVGGRLPKGEDGPIIFSVIE